MTGLAPMGTEYRLTVAEVTLTNGGCDATLTTRRDDAKPTDTRGDA